jgi:hypothetical protein
VILDFPFHPLPSSPPRYRKLVTSLVIIKVSPLAMISYGTTRLVLCLGAYAIKVAKGKAGRRCNLFEADLWKRTTEWRRLMLCLPFGVALVMKRAKPLSEEEKDHLIDVDGFPDWDYVPPDETAPFEYKASDWGRLEGRLVALDYSAPALF